MNGGDFGSQTEMAGASIAHISPILWWWEKITFSAQHQGGLKGRAEWGPGPTTGKRSKYFTTASLSSQYRLSDRGI